MDTTHPEDNTAVVAAFSDCCLALERTLSTLRDNQPRTRALESVRGDLAKFASMAAENEVPPERMIVMLKRTVRELPAIRSWLDTERDKLSHELVRMSISAYFGLDGTEKV